MKAIQILGLAAALAGLAVGCGDDDEPTGGTDSGTDTGVAMNECGGTTVLDDAVGSDCGVCDSGTWACDGTNALRCTGELAEVVTDLTSTSGTATASTVFGSFTPESAVDDERNTSWFSTGPEGAGIPTTFTWTAEQDVCVTQIGVLNNDENTNPDFQEGFGFSSMTIQLLDELDEVLFSKVEDVTPIPDPDLSVDVPNGVVARKVRVLMTGHEAAICGGFSELTLVVRR